MNAENKSDLIRSLGLFALIVYGVGDVLGAGIYAIVGKIAGHAGPLAWLSFLIAMFIVLFTALSYAELGSRYPRSGGVSIYIQEAFHKDWFSIGVGLLLFSATILSMSTLALAFGGYLRSFGFAIPDWLGSAGFLFALLLINIRGIKQSSITNIISTLIEISGLLIVLVCGLWYLSKTPQSTPATELPSLSGILQGAALAFFSFMGFEDLANIAEEVKHPEKNLPRAILGSLGMAGGLYLAVSWTATAVIPGTELSQSDSPLLDVVTRSYPSMPTYIFTIIAIFAVANTTLLNYITASRLLYGMSKAKLLPQFLQRVHRKYHTPHVAILIIFPIVFVLTLGGTLKGLAGSTSAIVLTVFSFSCLALIKIKWHNKKQQATQKIFNIPLFVPFVAVGLNIATISFLPLDSIIPAALFVACGLLVIGCFQLLKVK